MSVRRRAAIRTRSPRKASTTHLPTVGRGRPRSQDVREKVLAATNVLLEERGFKATTMEAIAEQAGASKVTLYRWWPNKAAVVMDAFFTEHSPRIPLSVEGKVADELRAHMRAFCKLVSGKTGRLLRGLIAEGVIDPVVGAAFRERWVAPRRAEMRTLLHRAIVRNELPADLDIELVTDALFGPLYHRLLTLHQEVTTTYADNLCALVLRGIRGRHAI
jgi:AcrR family transcriptional regulator